MRAAGPRLGNSAVHDKERADAYKEHIILSRSSGRQKDLLGATGSFVLSQAVANSCFGRGDFDSGDTLH